MSRVRYAGFWIRFLADVVDSTILTAVSWVLTIGVLAGFYWMESQWAGGQRDPFTLEVALQSIQAHVISAGMYFCVAFPYYVWGHYRWGTTLGKKIFGIRVVSERDLSGLTMKQSIVRFLCYGLSYAAMVTGFLMAAFHPRKMALHDVIAGTVSIRGAPALPQDAEII